VVAAAGRIALVGAAGVLVIAIDQIQVQASGHAAVVADRASAAVRARAAIRRRVPAHAGGCALLDGARVLVVAIGDVLWQIRIAVGGFAVSDTADAVLAQARDAKAVAAVAAVDRAGKEILAFVACSVAAARRAILGALGGPAVLGFADAVAAYLESAVFSASCRCLALVAALVAARRAAIGRADFGRFATVVAFAFAIATGAAAVDLASLRILAGIASAVAAALAVGAAVACRLAAVRPANAVAAGADGRDLVAGNIKCVSLLHAIRSRTIGHWRIRHASAIDRSVRQDHVLR